MNLFSTKNNILENLLPTDGIVHYYGKIFSDEECFVHLENLQRNIEWKNEKIELFGKTIITKRKVAWYAETGLEYTYSKKTKTALPWTKELLILKEKVEIFSGKKFNSCLLNLYHNGEEGMGWHSDDEPELEKNDAIASLSFGAERRFVFKHKRTAEKVALSLENGSLLTMLGNTQTNWLHSLPKTRKVHAPRINLTFRNIAPSKF
ncbi:MAG TPA: alpha-ketoglutarate-dependent dioxygenase AlkB [Flavobacteriaceae bacterium]|nr:alpha-ketoglutarate-dependent dioxygenase AlkB [Flavobacteriaceae bacterium]